MRPEKASTPNDHFFIAAQYPITQRPRRFRATGPQSKLAQQCASQFAGSFCTLVKRHASGPPE